MLADGWYSGYVGYGKKRDHYGTKPRFRALLHLELADGTTTDVVTSPDPLALISWTIRGG